VIAPRASCFGTALLFVALAAIAGGAGDKTARSPGSEGVQWSTGSFEDAVARARREKKLVLFDAWAKWCRPCWVMEREVWSRGELARALQRETVPVRVEVDRVHGVGLAIGDKYGIQALPQALFIDPRTGEVLKRLEGVQTPEAILEALDVARAKAGGAEQLAAAGDSSAALVRLAGQLARAEKLGDARTAADKAFALDKDCSRDDADDAALLLADLDEQSGNPAGAVKILEEGARRCAKASGTEELWRRLGELAPRAGGLGEQERILRLQADRRADDPDALRALASFLSEQSRDLEAAERAAARALELGPDDPASLAVMAGVRLKQKKYTEAQTLVERAIGIDPHDPALRELRLRILRAARP
jgi:thioredoxin-like negative regulator of GroEL